MIETGDYISRETAIAEIEEWHDMYSDSDAAREALSLAKRAIRKIPSADVRPVVTCSDCKWWTKQESSLQGRCELLQMYPTGAWFCANGKREES